MTQNNAIKIGLEHFKSFENKKELAAWAVRQYFSPKQSSKPWFKEGINEKNVFAHISDYKNGFPYSPLVFTSFYKTLMDARKSIENLTDPGGTQYRYEPKIRGHYSKGEETMSNIADDISLTCTMTGKIINKGLTKLALLCGDQNFLDPNGFDTTEINQIIDKHKYSSARHFAECLKNSEGDMEKFIVEDLMETQCFLREADLQFITEDEKSELANISKLERDDIVDILMFDFEQRNKLFKTFQYVFSKMLYRDLKQIRKQND